MFQCRRQQTNASVESQKFHKFQCRKKDNDGCERIVKDIPQSDRIKVNKRVELRLVNRFDRKRRKYVTHYKHSN
jgi:hypothetical protein